MIRQINPTESQIQCAIVEWANNTFVDHPYGGKVRLGGYLIKIPNEGKRSWNQGKKMKKEGMKKGVSDLFLAFPSKGETESYSYDYDGFWFETKSKGKKPTDKQLEFLAAMEDIGYGIGWADNVDDGIQAFKNYLRIK